MASSDPKILLECVSRERLHPQGGPKSPQTVPISILDNTVIRFDLTGAVWYFDSNPNLTVDSLTESLKKTLPAYHQWAGQLHWLPYDLSKRQRFGRAALTFGSPSDPGVELIVARCPRALADLIPDIAVRMACSAWDPRAVPSAALLLPTTLAMYMPEFMGCPVVSVQLATFACGGISVAVRISHPVADATAMMQFMNDWAAVHRALAAGRNLPMLSPIFDPSLVDRAASGDIHAAKPDPTLLAIARALPAIRNDWWISAPGCPEPMLPMTKVPEELEDADLGEPGDPMPWAEWDLTAPIAQRHIYFTPREIQRIWEAAQPPDTVDPSAPRISRLDALIAHLWRATTRARGLTDDLGALHMAVMFGLRARVAPPLPTSFLGSPLTLATASVPASVLAAPTGRTPGALAMRRAVAAYTPSAVGALLHEAAHAVCPQREWRAFLGRRHAVVTSWLHAGVRTLDFGVGAGAVRYVDPVLPSQDGLFHVLEAAAGDGKWYDVPVCVSFHVAADVMERLLRDPELRQYA